MTGEQLKNTLYINKIEQQYIATELGITKQAFSKMLTVADVKTGTLEKICRIIGKDMSFFYPECAASNLSQVSNCGINSGVIGSGSMATQVESATVKGLIEQLKNKDEQLKAKDEQIDKLINLLANK